MPSSYVLAFGMPSFAELAVLAAIGLLFIGKGGVGPPAAGFLRPVAEFRKVANFTFRQLRRIMR
jgi:hypothetical protein